MQAQTCPPNHFCAPPIHQSQVVYAGIAGGVLLGLFGRSLSRVLRWGVKRVRAIAPRQADATPVDEALLAIADLISGEMDAVGKEKLTAAIADPQALAYLVNEKPETVDAVIAAVDRVAHDPSQAPQAIAELALKGVAVDAIGRFLGR